MRSLENWFDAYGQSHRHPTNKIIHFICVPLITYSLMALLWLSSPYALLALLVIATIFYLQLSWRLMLAMLLMTTLSVGSFYYFEPDWLLKINIALFILAWIGQFIGHKIEGAKPSFFEDIQFLLIGPIWILAFLLNKLGINLK